MSKLELSINVQYLPSWGAWEGIRELIQNGKDAETEFSAPLKVDWRGGQAMACSSCKRVSASAAANSLCDVPQPDGDNCTGHFRASGTLRIENEGAELTREALLFGTSSKADRSDMIGKFGEGLKLGILALVRAGHPVKIRTGAEVWTAGIARSERYDADVLCFDCVGGREAKKRVRVEIENVTALEWERLKERFLFLVKRTVKDAESMVATSRGDLLLGEKYVGQIFVKGIYVSMDARLSAGYNFRNVDLDRDRKMVSSWDLQWTCSQIWTEAAASRPDLLGQLFSHALDGKADVAGLEHNASYAPDAVKECMAATFAAKFGERAVPVANLAESAEVEHLGRRGVVVSKSLGALLATTLGTKEQMHAKLKSEVVRTLSWGDMTDTQKADLLDAVKLVAAVRSECTLDLIDVVEFNSVGTLGQFKDGRILLAARMLDDRDELLATIVHEFSHRCGGDGEKDHVMAIEDMWRDIVKHLRNGGV
jgi:hypothetical protein